MFNVFSAAYALCCDAKPVHWLIAGRIAPGAKKRE